MRGKKLYFFAFLASLREIIFCYQLFSLNKFTISILHYFTQRSKGEIRRKKLCFFAF